MSERMVLELHETTILKIKHVVFYFSFFLSKYRKRPPGIGFVDIISHVVIGTYPDHRNILSTLERRVATRGGTILCCSSVVRRCTFFRERSWIGTTVGLEPEGRRSCTVYVNTTNIR